MESLRRIVLTAVMGVAGCQSGFGERPLLPLIRPVELAQPPLALSEPKSADGLIQTVTHLKAGGADQESALKTADLHEVLRSCFEREQMIDLESALRTAHGANPTIGLAEEIVQANLAERMLARSLLFPTVNAGTTLTVHRGALMTGRGVIQDVNRESLYFGAGADVRGAGTVAVPGLQVISNLSDAVFAPRVADQKVTSSQFDAAATRNNVLLEVAKSYLALVGAEARLLAYRQSESEFAEVARLTANFAKTGAGKEADAQRAQSELALVQSDAQAAEEDVVVWAAQLSRWLSADPSIRLRPEPGTPPLIQLVDERAPLESLVETAIVSRPEIAARSADVARNETRLRQERVRPLVPTLLIGVSAGDFGGGSNLVGYRFSHFSGRTDIDVLAVWTLQNLGFGNVAVQNKVRAEIGQAEAYRTAMLNQVRSEVAEALALTKASRQQMDIARRRVENAQTAARQDLDRNKDPRLGRVIEVLRSYNLLATARQDLVQEMVRYSRAQFQLYVAIGGMPTAPQVDAAKQ